jgi:hypothetical protein
MRAVVKAVQSVGKGVSYQARYIAESELNRERGGEKPRPLFTNRGHDGLTYRAANRFLTSGEGDPLKKDLIHIIISFEEKDFEALRAHDDERIAALREVAHEAMEETKADLRVRDWRWVAGIHLNTDNPHIHLLIHKEIASDDPERRRLGNIPKRLLPSQVTGQDGETHPTEGIIGGNFVRALESGISLQALRQGKLAPSPALASLLKELEASRTGRQVLNFEASLYEVSLHKAQVNKQRRTSYESLTAHERRYLSERIEEQTRSLARERGSDESVLLEANRKRPSLAGRYLTREIIVRGQETASGEPPDVLHDPRAAFKDRDQHDPHYETPYGKAGWISKHSQWLRDDYERGTVIKEEVLVIPAEGYELNPEIHGRGLFIHELRYALKEIQDPEKASEFHRLATIIAGRNAGADGRAGFFSSYYDLLKREGGDETGRELAPRETEARAVALEITLGKMRELAPLMEELETEVSIEAHRPDMLVSLEQVRESKLAAISAEPAFGDHEDGEKELEGKPKGGSYVFNTAARKVNLRDESLRFPAGLSQEAREQLVAHTLPWIDQQIESGVNRSEILEEINRFYYEWADSSSRLTLTERLKKEKDAYHRIGYFIKAYADERIAAREERDAAGPPRPFRISINESPPGLTKEAQARLAEETLPWIDKQIESGASRTEIYRRVKQQFHQVEVTVEDLVRRPVAVPGFSREAAVERAGIVHFCREYLYERLKDLETREINRSETFREVHRQMMEANSVKEMNQAAGYAFKKGHFDWDRRALIFSGLAPVHHTPEMRILRTSFALSREDRAKYAKQIEAGKREPSPVLQQLLVELNSRNKPESIAHYRASIKNEKMRNPGKLKIYELHKRLPTWERDYLYLKIGEQEERVLSRRAARSEPTTVVEVSSRFPAPHDNESLRQYLEERKVKEAELIKAAASRSLGKSEEIAQPEGTEKELLMAADSLPPEELAAVRERARLRAWDSLVPEEVFDENPSREAQELSDAIAEMQEEIQPEARRAVTMLDEFSLRTTGHPYHEIPPEALNELSPENTRWLEEHKQLADRNLKRLYDGFENIDGLRQEIERARGGSAQMAAEISGIPAEAQTLVQALPPGREPEAAALVASVEKERGEQQKPHPVRRTFGEPSRESRSYREYTAAAAEIERQLIEEAIREKRTITKDQPEIATADILLAREEKLRIRTAATRRALTRLEPQRILGNDPAEIPLLKLQGTVILLRDEAQSRARESAREVDAFIRSRGLERFIEKKTDYYYRGDQLPESALKELTGDEKQAFATLEKQANATFREFKAGFWTIDRLRSEIDQSRNGHATPAAPKSRGEPGVAGSDRPPETRSSLNGFWRGSSPRHAGQANTEIAVKVTKAPTPTQTMKETGCKQTPPAFPLGESAGESRSYREYVTAVAETEQRLLGELERQSIEAAARERQGIDQAGPEAASTDISLDREEKLRIRSYASHLAWEQLEPRPMSANDPAKTPILSLREAIVQVRDGAQPRAWKEAWKLDVFIRTRGLDESAAEKTDYFYRADQIPEGELAKLTPAERREFANRENNAAAALREFKTGFDAIDRLRDEIERIDDRVILGRDIIAHAHSDAATLDFEIADRFGHTFRFEIKDASVGTKRRISDLDVRRRANAHGDRAADEGGLERYDERLEIRTRVSGADILDHSTTLDEHGRKLDRLTGELKAEAMQALASHLHAQSLAGEVAEKYRILGKPLPTPLVERGVLVEAQDEAIKHRLAGHTEKLEWLRAALAEEHGQPMRSDTEMARLSAQVFTARTELRAQEAHARRFDETRHLRQWEIAIDRQGQIVTDRQEEIAADKQEETRVEKYSLYHIDREMKHLKDEARIGGDRVLHLDPVQRRNAKAELELFGRIRDAVIEKIEERQRELRERVAEASQLHDTLVRAHEREASFREQMGLEMPARQFTRSELERAAKNIETARDAEGLRDLTREERRFNEYADPKERFKPVEEWGRAPGRALMAVMFYRESVGRLEASEERGERQPMLIEKPGGALQVERLSDTYPKSAAEWALRPLLELVSTKAKEDRDVRVSVQEAYAQHEVRLQGDVELHRVYMETARGIASEQVAERARIPGLELPQSPLALTAEQAMRLEIYATRQTDSEVRRELLGLARGSAQSHFDPYSQSQTHPDESEQVHEKTPEVGRTR